MVSWGSHGGLMAHGGLKAHEEGLKEGAKGGWSNACTATQAADACVASLYICVTPES